MKEDIKNELRLSLSKDIDGWYGTLDLDDLPYVGENICSNMAEAALNVLLAVEDAQNYLKSQGMYDESGGQTMS
jgi:hypothetical protein